MSVVACSPLNGRPGRRAVAIVGTSEDPRLAPLDGQDVDIWGMNRAHFLFRDRQGRFRADLWFDLHEMVAQEPVDHRWFRVCPVPLYLPEADPRYPQSRRFPAEVCVAQGRDYFTCSVAYLVAFALARGYQEVQLYGCDLTAGREVAVERACASYWLGLAEGRGVRVTIGPSREPAWRLLHHPTRYGLDYVAEKAAVEAFVRSRLGSLWADAGRPEEMAVARDEEVV